MGGSHSIDVPCQGITNAPTTSIIDDCHLDEYEGDNGVGVGSKNAIKGSPFAFIY